MGYKNFMGSLRQDFRGYVLAGDSDGMFDVLDRIKTEVEGDPSVLAGMEELATGLKRYHLSRKCKWSVGLRLFQDDVHICSCKNGYPLATTAFVIGGYEEKEIMDELVQGKMERMLARIGGDAARFRFYPRRGAEEGNRYRLVLRGFSNAYAELSVLHKVMPSTVMEIERELKRLGKEVERLMAVVKAREGKYGSPNPSQEQP